MKKIFAWMMIVFVMLSVSACGDDTRDDDNRKRTGKKVTVESFAEKVDGYWGYEDDDGNWQILEFKDGKVSDYTYAGAMWLYQGNIEKVKELSDGAVEATISFEEVAYGDEETSGEKNEVVYTFKTEDGYEETLILVGEVKNWSYSYIGEDKSDLDERMAEIW